MDLKNSVAESLEKIIKPIRNKIGNIHRKVYK